MNKPELFGGVLYDASELTFASRVLARLLKAPQTDRSLAVQAGLDTRLVDSLRHLALEDELEIDHACSLGAAWVSGRRSVPQEDTWETVASLPVDLALPKRLNRTTAETLIGLANRARIKLRLAAPFMDMEGVGYIKDSIVAATLRQVRVELIRSISGLRERESVSLLLGSVEERGCSEFFSILDPIEGTSFPHLKVVTTDGSTAYIGSANLTGAALTGRNLEFGVLVRGEQVQTLDRFLDLYTGVGM